jgi:soluble lytic murein transglycosylase-like protein
VGKGLIPLLGFESRSLRHIEAVIVILISSRSLLLGAALTLASTAIASPLPDYLKARKKFGITQATTTLALDTLVGEGTLEVKALVKGTFSVDGRTSLLVEVAGSDPIVVKGQGTPTWLSTPQTEARLLIKAKRQNEFGVLDAQLVDAIEERVIANWEKQEAAKAAKAATPRYPAPVANRGGTRTWNLAPHQAVPVYANFIRGYNPRLTSQKATEIAQGIIGFSIQFGVDARLITAMVLVESGFNPQSTSRTGAMGLGQLMPGTASGMGVRNAYDTFENLWGTVRLIRGHLEKYSGVSSGGEKFYDLVTALAAYNAGSGAVRRYGGVPPYKETQNYIRKVTEWYRALSGS